MNADPLFALLRAVADPAEVERYIALPDQPHLFDGEHLAALPLTGLLALIERKQSALEDVPPQRARLRPTMLVSLRPLLSGDEPKASLEKLGERIETIDQLLGREQLLSCVLSDWNTEGTLNEMLRVLLAVSERFREVHPKGILIGPPLHQCRELAERHSLSLQSFLTRLLNHGIGACAAGPKIGSERTALELGLILTIESDISFLADNFHVAEGPGEREEGPADSILLSRHVTEILELAEELDGKNFRWIYEPCWSETTFRHALTSPFAVPVARALAIARLLLPETVTVDARYPLVGRHLAQLLADYGITSLGAVAADPDTASALNVPLMSEVAPLDLAYPAGPQP